MFGVITNAEAFERNQLEKYYNFGVVYPDKLYRSKAPSRDFLEYVRDIYGVKVVIDLRSPSSEREAPRILREREWAEELGLKFISIPEVTYETALLIRDLIGDEPILIHCQAGRDRTGGIVAYQRYFDGWSYRDVRKELKKFGHKPRENIEYHKYLEKLFSDPCCK